ncbi:MAG: hypothetical protein K2F79_02025, partial [Muribaculaceae bacterium]|nr:hypothetical protein [Muribaculaceae bacterium]
YKKLKEVHERTGRPIWITEWNNGANWTHESWPSDKAAQQEKQRKFMAEVLEMMDTCSFIERYSVYNWVEEKRALFHGDKNLTPAGKVYRDFEAASAFSRSEEFVPQWKVGNIASLSLAYAGNGRIRLSWTDADCEQVEGYDVERACGSGQYSLVAKAPYKASSYEMELEGIFSDGADMNYRVVSTDRHGERYPSNTVSCAAIASGGTVLAGRRIMGKGALLHVLPTGAGQAPVAILGTQTYRMKAPMLTTLGAVDSKVCNFGPVSWNYNSSDSFVSRDTVSYIIFPHAGEFDLGGIRAYAGQLAGVTAQPVRVNFPSAFSSAPVVLATAHSADSEYPAVARVGMVTPSGFDLSIAREQKAAGEDEPLAVSYVAIAPGSAELDGHTIACGLARGVEPGVSSTSTARITYGDDFGTSAFFALPQDGADEGASALRAVTISGTGANIFLNPELAASAPGTSRRDIGWFAISDAGAQSAIGAAASSQASLSYDNAARVLTGPEGTKVRVYTPSGICVLEGSATPELSVAGLASGFYIACASSSASSSVSFCITE